MAHCATFSYRAALIIVGVSQRFVPQLYGLERSGSNHLS
jgi:hypothetical protein